MWVVINQKEIIILVNSKLNSTSHWEVQVEVEAPPSIHIFMWIHPSNSTRQLINSTPLQMSQEFIQTPMEYHILKMISTIDFWMLQLQVYKEVDIKNKKKEWLPQERTDGLL